MVIELCTLNMEFSTHWFLLQLVAWDARPIGDVTGFTHHVCSGLHVLQNLFKGIAIVPSVLL